MEFKATKKEVLNSNKTVLKIGYCDLQHLLSNKNRIAWTEGVNGWNADIYEVRGVIICTGYRPFGREVDYELVREYEIAAENIASHNSWDVVKIELDKLQIEFLEKAGIV